MGDLFKRWLFYGIGTMFSMAVLAAMVGIALDMVIRVASTFWLTAAADKWILQDSGAAGFTSQAMQQGGMGLILTTLILTAPPMAAMFFQGTLGGFYLAQQEWHGHPRRRVVAGDQACFTGSLYESVGIVLWCGWEAVGIICQLR